MKLLSKIYHRILRDGPKSISRFLTSKISKTIHSCILDLKIEDGYTIEIDGNEMRVLKFQNGSQIIGHKATKIEEKILGGFAEEVELDSSYSKILIDAVTRYTYPHMGGAILSMKQPIEERHMLHPQQKNFLLEEESIPMELRQKISKHFEPKSDWKCLDVGAFLGHGAMWLREQTGSNSKIICVEANKSNYNVIKTTLRINNIENINPIYSAIWHTSGESITFNTSIRQANSIDETVVQGTNKISVPTVSIKSLTNELGGAADFLSLTVNGAEIEAIEGMKNMDKKDLPRRIIAPAWYPKDGKSRMNLIEPLYKELGYNYVSTSGELTFAWLGEI